MSALFLPARHAWATLIAEFRTFSGSFSLATDVTFSGINATVHNPRTGVYRIYTDTPSDNLGTVSFTGSSNTNLIHLVIGNGDAASGQSMAAGCRNWAGLSTGGFKLRVQAHIDGDLTGTVDAP